MAAWRHINVETVNKPRNVARTSLSVSALIDLVQDISREAQNINVIRRKPAKQRDINVNRLEYETKARKIIRINVNSDRVRGRNSSFVVVLSSRFITPSSDHIIDFESIDLLQIKHWIVATSHIRFVVLRRTD